MGSRTFHDMIAFWPTSTAVFAPPMNGIPKAVFTRRDAAALKTPRTTTALLDARADAVDNASAVLQPGAESWAEAYVASGALTDEIAKLKAEDGKPIIAHGGAGFARSLIAENLVDRYALLVHPVVLGKGLAIFDGVAATRRLQLVNAKTFPKGAVAKIYRPA
jgi:dihydrofolate reductase